LSILANAAARLMSAAGRAGKVSVRSMVSVGRVLISVSNCLEELDLWEANGRPRRDEDAREISAAPSRRPKLILNELDGRPHHIDLLSAVWIAPQPVRMSQAVIVSRALQQFREGVRFIGGHAQWDGDNLSISHWNLSYRFRWLEPGKSWNLLLGSHFSFN